MPGEKEQFKSLMNDFKKSSGKVFFGAESRRNAIGRMWHGFCYKHPTLAKTTGVTLFFAGWATSFVVGLSAGFLPAVAAGLPTALVSPFLISPEQKEACQFLMNVAVKKAHLLNRFMKDEKGMDAVSRQKAIEMCLKTSMPAFCAEEYARDFPNAASQIANSSKEDDLPVYRNEGVFKMEMAEKIFKKWKTKQDILHIASNYFTGTMGHVRGYIEKIAPLMAKDYEKWRADPNPEKRSWGAFERDYIVSVPSKDQAMPKDWTPKVGAHEELSVAEAMQKISESKEILNNQINSTTLSPVVPSIASEEAKTTKSTPNDNLALYDALRDRNIHR